MKLAKIFTEGLAVMLAVFILIFVLTNYVKYSPKEEKLEESSKLELYLEEKAESDVLYLWLAALLFLAVGAGIALRRMPAVGAFLSVLPTGYALTLLSWKHLPTRPMTVVLLCFAYTAGSVVYAAAEERRLKRNVCANAGILCALGGLAVTGVSAFFQGRAATVADLVEEMSEASLSISKKLGAFPTLVRMIWARFACGEQSSASKMASNFEKSLNTKGTRLYFFMNIDAEQFRIYLRLALLFFALAVLWFVFRGKLRPLAAVLSALPLIYAYHHLMRDNLSAMPLVILLFALMSAVLGFVSFEQGGRVPVSEVERQQILDELHTAPEPDPMDGDGRDEYGNYAPDTKEDEIEYDK